MIKNIAHTVRLFSVYVVILTCVVLGVNCGSGGGDNNEDNDVTTWYRDLDGDGYSDGTTYDSKTQPTGYFPQSSLTATSGDCDDNSSSVHPGATENCGDEIDQDCDGIDLSCTTTPVSYSYIIVDTGVEEFYSDSSVIDAPGAGSAYFGQDAHYQKNVPDYSDNGDGTIIDNMTGLMWQQDMGEKISFSDAQKKAEELILGGYSDWRVPTIKELYSLILFTGSAAGETSVIKYIDTNYFNQPLGDADTGEREIDAQTWSATEYVGTTMNGNATVFGVNFIDGRIKGYPKYSPGIGEENKMYFRMVRGNTDYGKNTFISNEDGTISDLATGLMWQQADDGIPRDWEEALYCCESLEASGFADWRLPNAKELQSIVDYTRSPQTTGSPAIHSLFVTTEINDPEGNPGQYPYFWTGTTHLDGTNPYSSAVYIAFGEGQGQMNGQLMDVHGAGCQRSDPKSGDPAEYPVYWGPQGDVRYVYNYVRCVRNIE